MRPKPLIATLTAISGVSLVCLRQIEAGEPTGGGARVNGLFGEERPPGPGFQFQDSRDGSRREDVEDPASPRDPSETGNGSGDSGPLGWIHCLTPQWLVV